MIENLTDLNHIGAFKMYPQFLNVWTNWIDLKSISSEEVRAFLKSYVFREITLRILSLNKYPLHVVFCLVETTEIIFGVDRKSVV